MKKFSIVCIVILVLGRMTIPAFAQRYEVDVHPPDDVMDTELTINVGEKFCFDVYLTGATLGEPRAGGVWVDYVSSIGLVSYVSATDVVPPWTAAPTVNEPERPGTFFSKVANLGGVQVSDETGNILITTMCFNCIAGGDVTFDLTAAVDPSYWGDPYDDATINANTTNPTLTIHQVCECTADEDCQDGLWCNGNELCSNCSCYPGKPVCDNSFECSVGPCREPDPICGIIDCEEIGGTAVFNIVIHRF